MLRYWLTLVLLLLMTLLVPKHRVSGKPQLGNMDPNNVLNAAAGRTDVLLAEASSSSEVRVPPTPCPNVFEYRWWNNEIVGALSASPPVRYRPNEPIKLLLTMALEALITTGYVGTIELFEDKNVVFSRLQSGSNQPILYKVRFPLRSPVPIVSAIDINGQRICTGRGTSATLVTMLTLHHSLLPDGVTDSSNNNFNNNFNNNQQSSFQQPSFQQPQRPQEPQRPQTPRPPQAPTNQRPPPQNPPSSSVFMAGGGSGTNQWPWLKPEPTTEQVTPPPWQTPPPTQAPQPVTVAPWQTAPPVFPPSGGSQSSGIRPTISNGGGVDVCGQPSPGVSLVVLGQNTKKGQWPWLTAIFVKTSLGHDFHCGGSLVSINHVITAAHCIKDPNRPAYQPDEVLVHVGRFNLKRAEQESQARDVARIVMHPSYGAGKHDSDVAMLVLDTPVEITRYVRPVCLPTKQTLPDTSKKGIVVGWGRDEKGNRVTNEPKSAEMPVVSQEECLRSNSQFFHVTSENTYCAGARDGSGPCNGDSGGGMYFLEPQPDGTSRWILRGIVSLSLSNAGQCDLNNYIVFTNMAKFYSWIRGVIGPL